jgi:hypothetical protein
VEGVSWRLVPVTLLAATLVAQSSGHRAVATYLLLLSVPAAAAAALVAFGELVELPGGARGVGLARVSAALAGLGLVLVLAAAVVERPSSAASALVGAFGLFAAATLARTAVPLLRRAPAR